jgi:hypothetical protein
VPVTHVVDFVFTAEAADTILSRYYQRDDLAGDGRAAQGEVLKENDTAEALGRKTAEGLVVCINSINVPDLALARCKQRRQGVGGGVRRMPHIGQAKGGFNGLQQRIVRVEARILRATYPVVRDGD